MNKPLKEDKEKGLGRSPKLAIVVPCYNEEKTIPSSHRQLMELVGSLVAEGIVGSDSFILYVDDGSYDSTWEIIEDITGEDTSVRGLKLAGNVGQQNALMAGLEFVADKCDVSVTIDVDLQDDINVIPDMIAAYRNGCEIVYGVRARRDADTWLVRTTATSFYRIMSKMGVPTVFNHSDFRLLSRRALKELLRYDERNLYLRGIVPNIGLRSSRVYYDRRPRLSGETKYPFAKRVGLAIDGITSFSIRPVRLVFGIGVAFIFITLCIFIYVMIRYFQGATIEGWTSLMLSIWFCTGVLLLSLGVIGEYVGKIYTEAKHRPRYMVEKFTQEVKDEKNNDSDSGL